MPKKKARRQVIVTNIYSPSLDLQTAGMVRQKKAKLAIDTAVVELLNSR